MLNGFSCNQTCINFILTLPLACLLLLSCSSQASDTNKPHHSDNGFKNVYNYQSPGLFDFFKWQFNRLNKNIPGPEDYDFPLAENDPLFLKTNRKINTLTWIGHATVLLQLEGKNILTDPHFSERASPVQWVGPKRVMPPGILINDLPRIDIVCISHDHYDSLDKQTIKELYEREGGQQTVFFVPLGLKTWFKKLGISRVVELDWWEQHEESKLNITAVPLQHWSKRSFLSRNQTLWAGWVIKSDMFSFFFSGDSGYTQHFKEIGNRLGPFDLSAIPIGAYEPRWFMRYHHISPEEAAQVHMDVHSRMSVAIHWGTFILSDEPLDEPPRKLKEAIKERTLSQNEFLILKHGETINLD